MVVTCKWKFKKVDRKSAILFYYRGSSNLDKIRKNRGNLKLFCVEYSLIFFILCLIIENVKQDFHKLSAFIKKKKNDQKVKSNFYAFLKFKYLQKCV